MDTDTLGFHLLNEETDAFMEELKNSINNNLTNEQQPASLTHNDLSENDTFTPVFKVPKKKKSKKVNPAVLFEQYKSAQTSRLKEISTQYSIFEKLESSTSDQQPNRHNSTGDAKQDVKSSLTEYNNKNDIWKVFGHCQQLEPGLSERAVKFIFTKPPQLYLEGNFENPDDQTRLLDTRERMPFLNDVALFDGDVPTLPTFNSHVHYTLLIRVRKAHPTWDVLLPILETGLSDCHKKSVTKKELVHYCPFAKDCIQNLPETGITKETVKNRMKESELSNRLYRWLSVLSESNDFFYLLRFYSATVVSKLSAAQQQWLVLCIKTNPFLFCFRLFLEQIQFMTDTPFYDHAVVSRKKSLLNPKNQFEADFYCFTPDTMTQMTLFDVSPTYALGRKNLSVLEISMSERMLALDHCKAGFDPRYCLLTLNDVLQVSKEENIDYSNMPPEFMQSCLNDYLTFEKNRYALSSSTITMPNVTRSSACYLAQFMKIREISPELGWQFQLEADAELESLCTHVFLAYVKSTTLYESLWYNPVYMRNLGTFLNDTYLKNLKATAPRYFFSVGKTFSRELSAHSKLPFVDVPQAMMTPLDICKRTLEIEEIATIRLQQQQNFDLSKTNPVLVVIEHVHKLSILQFTSLLLNVVDDFEQRHILQNGNDQNRSQIQIQLVLIGDEEDYPQYRTRSLGDLWKELKSVFKSSQLPFQREIKESDKDKDTRRRFGVSHEVYQLRQNLLNSNPLETMILRGAEKLHDLCKLMILHKRKLNNPLPKDIAQEKKLYKDLLELDAKGKMQLSLTTGIALRTKPTPTNVSNIQDNQSSTGALLNSQAPPKKNGPKERRIVNISCSGAEERNQLSKKFVQTGLKDFDANTFYVGNLVTVEPHGFDGILKAIFRIGKNGEKIPYAKSTRCQPLVGDWCWWVCPCNLSSSCQCKDSFSSTNSTLRHRFVNIFQEQVMTPVECGMFYVSQNTTLRELVAFTHYATHKIEFYRLNETVANSVYFPNRSGASKRETNLGKKLKSIINE